MKKETLNQYIKEFREGTSAHAYRFMGCHPDTQNGRSGYMFRVWAPRAKSVNVFGSFNNWDQNANSMFPIGDGIWDCFIPDAKSGDEYKYCIETYDGRTLYKADPYGFCSTLRPNTNSVVYDLAGYKWDDGAYRRKRASRKPLRNAVNIYEVHLGSWMLHEDGSFLTYEESAVKLAEYAKDMGYTHVELLPISEYPYDPSWGYQVTGYYAPTSRFGTPHDFMKFVDILHGADIGVIVDIVPAHFTKDAHGLYEFDGTSCYEPDDDLMKEHPEWGTRIFDYGRNEVRSFLVSNAVYWLDMFHIDGLRIDAVASMLHLNYARADGQWRPNKDGGHINLEAVKFIQDMNIAAYRQNSSVMMIAEDSTAFPLVTRPVYDGGLGFTFKWNMGWMHDMLDYMSIDPIYRKWHHNNLTFSLTYAFSENYVLPFSHDEVVHGKFSLLNRMPGSYDDKFQNLRALYGYMMTHPGKKLLFMGGEFGQFIEWDFKRPLDWFLLDYDKHRQLHNFVRVLNHYYLDHAPLWQNDMDWNGFQWLTCDDRDQSVISFRRIDSKGKEVVVICNFCPVERTDYVIGVETPGTYTPVLSSDAAEYGGAGTVLSPVSSVESPVHGRQHSVSFTLPPQSTVIYEVTPAPKKGAKKAIKSI